MSVPHSCSSRRSARRRTGAFVRAALAGALCAAPLAPALGAKSPSKTYAVPAGSLEDGLNAFAQQAGVTLSFDPALVRGRSTQGLKGAATVAEGFGRLLKGSGYAVDGTSGSYVLVAERPKPKPAAAPVPPPGSGEQVLGTVEVRASAESDGYAPEAKEYGYRVKRSAATGYRDQAIIDTPFSVTAISNEVMRDQQARSLVDVTKNDPSITQAGDPLWYDRVNVRGFYLNTDAVQRDGLSINDQGPIALENKAAVEIAKGLSAMRYGMTSPGGVINYVVKRPTDETLARFIGSVNGFGGFGGHVDVGGRFGENQQFGVRFNAAGEDLTTFVEEVKGDKKFVSTFFDWRATDDLLFELDFEYQNREMTSVPELATWSFNSLDEARALFSRLNARIRTSQPWAVEPNEQINYGARAHYRFSDHWKARIAAQQSELSRSQKSVYAEQTQLSGDYNAMFYYSPDRERNNTAWQAVVEGDFDTWMLGHELAFGYDYVQRDMTWPDGFYGPIGTGNLFTRPFIPDPRAVSDPSFLRNRTEQSSGFFTDTIKYSDWLRLFAGLRYTQINIYGGEPSGARTETYDKGALTPTGGIVVKPWAEMSIYASYAEGIEQGGTAPLTARNRNQVMNPLMSRQYEVGVKYELPEGALLTAALFRIEKGLEYLNSNNTYVQDGSQIHQGVEATLSGQVTEDLRLITGFAYLDATVDETSDTNLIGKRPQGVPDWQANIFADYNLSRFIPGLSVNTGIYYSGVKAIDPENTWMAADYVRWDAGLRYQHAVFSKHMATLRVNVENLTDARYLANTTFGTLNFGAPLTFKASVTVDF